MDERLEKALEQANYAVTLQNQKRNLQLRFQNALTYSTGGGTFTVSRELISFVHALSQTSASGVLIDDRNNPVAIDDLKAFLETVTGVYQEAANDFLAGMTKLRKARTTRQSVEL